VSAPALPALALEAALRERALLPDPSRSLPEPGPGRPWFVSALLGVSGWLAGLFTLGFVGLLFRPDGEAGFAVLGLAVLGVSALLFRTAEGAFVEQGALALSVAGHGLLGVAIHDALSSNTTTAWAMAVLQALWILVVPARLPRLLATICACVAAAVALRLTLGAHDDEPFRTGRSGVGGAVLGWVALWAPVAVIARALVVTEVRWMAAGLQRLVRPVLTGLLVALALASPTSDPLEGLALWDHDAARAGWLSLWPVLSFAAAGWALWLSHRLRSGALMGAAIAGALLHVFHFYMLLGATLLVKSVVMALLGALLLAGAVVLRRRATP
jgi:hypothetical protein